MGDSSEPLLTGRWYRCADSHRSAVARARQGRPREERRRRQVIAGAYQLSKTREPQVTLCALGALVPEALAAADLLHDQDLAADFVCIASPDLLSPPRPDTASTMPRPGSSTPSSRPNRLPGRPAHTDGDGPGRSPAHAQLPGVGPRCHRTSSRRPRLRAVRRRRQLLPGSWHRGAIPSSGPHWA